MTARELAIDDPSLALDNGDSHEYFAENTPSESMGRAQAWVALSDGTRLGPGARWSDNFCAGQQVCRTGDVNGDGKADLIGFVRTDHLTDDSDVYVALSDGTRFGPARKWHDFFCTLDEVCAVADVNGDGKADLVTFVRTNHGQGDSDVWVALSDGTRFGPGQKWHDFFCTLNEVCAVGDVNGDGKADVIAFVRTNNGQRRLRRLGRALRRNALRRRRRSGTTSSAPSTRSARSATSTATARPTSSPSSAPTTDRATATSGSRSPTERASAPGRSGTTSSAPSTRSARSATSTATARPTSSPSSAPTTDRATPTSRSRSPTGRASGAGRSGTTSSARSTRSARSATSTGTGRPTSRR